MPCGKWKVGRKFGKEWIGVGREGKSVEIQIDSFGKTQEGNNFIRLRKCVFANSHTKINEKRTIYMNFLIHSWKIDNTMTLYFIEYQTHGILFDVTVILLRF